MSNERESCDVAVIGAGPAGIAAACAAAAFGRRVIVLDEGSAPGGQIWRPSLHSGSPGVARRWKARLDASGAHVHRSTSVVDIHRGVTSFSIRAEREGRALDVACGAVVL